MEDYLTIPVESEAKILQPSNFDPKNMLNMNFNENSNNRFISHLRDLNQQYIYIFFIGHEWHKMYIIL